MHKVIIVKTLYENEKDVIGSAVVDRELLLPFAPFEGLHLSKGSWLPGALKTIQWDDDDQVFYCSIVDSPSQYANKSALTINDLIQQHLSSGWNKGKIR